MTGRGWDVLLVGGASGVGKSSLAYPLARRYGVALSVALQPALEAVIGNHLETRMPLVIEGDFLLPALAVRAEFAGIPAAGRVRALFVVESDLDSIAENYRAREPDQGDQRLRAEVSMVWTRWIRTETARHGVAVLDARPWADGLARAEAALAGGA